MNESQSSSDTKPPRESTIEERAADAKFYLTIGGGSFILIAILLILPILLFLLPPNYIVSLQIAAIGYFLPGLFLFIWGLIKVYRGKDLTISQVRQAKIQQKDLRKTVKLVLFVTFFVVLVILPFLVGLSPLDLMNSIIQYSLIAFGPGGLFIGTFLISIFGNFTILFPIPYIFVLLLIAIQPGFTLIDGILMGLVVGLGATIGEIVSWLLGRSQTEALEDSQMGQRVLKVKDQVERGYGGLLIFFYAATPLPDDLLLIALGATRYPLWKTVIYCFFGKVALALMITIGAQMPGIRDVLMDVFGGVSDPFFETMYVVVGLFIILLIFLVPWQSVFRRIKGNK